MRKTEKDENIAQNLRALCHPRRMIIFRLLAETQGSELCFRQIQGSTNIGTTTLIHHLREMERGWLLTRQRKGSETYYKLSADSLLHSIDLIHEIMNARFRSSQAA